MKSVSSVVLLNHCLLTIIYIQSLLRRLLVELTALQVVPDCGGSRFFTVHCYLFTFDGSRLITDADGEYAGGVAAAYAEDTTVGGDALVGINEHECTVAQDVGRPSAGQGGYAVVFSSMRQRRASGVAVVVPASASIADDSTVAICRSRGGQGRQRHIFVVSLSVVVRCRVVKQQGREGSDDVAGSRCGGDSGLGVVESADGVGRCALAQAIADGIAVAVSAPPARVLR